MADYGLLTNTNLQAQLTTLLAGICTPTVVSEVVD